MTEHPLQWIVDQPGAVALLRGYGDLEAARRANPREASRSDCAELDASADGADSSDADDAESWLPRLTSLPGLQPDNLPALHGRLIALGLLRFELFGRAGGMRYRLSTLGRRALEPAPAAAIDDNPGDDPQPAVEADEPELTAA